MTEDHDNTTSDTQRLTTELLDYIRYCTPPCTVLLTTRSASTADVDHRPC